MSSEHTKACNILSCLVSSTLFCSYRELSAAPSLASRPDSSARGGSMPFFGMYDAHNDYLFAAISTRL